MSLVGRGLLNNWWRGLFGVFCSSGWHCSLWAMIHSPLRNKLFQGLTPFPLSFFKKYKACTCGIQMHAIVSRIEIKELIHVLQPIIEEPQRTLPGSWTLGKTSFLREEERYRCVKFLLAAKISRAAWIEMRPFSPRTLVIYWVWQGDNWYSNCMPIF